MILEQNRTTTKNSKEEWCSMENQLYSVCQERILKVQRNHWRIFFLQHQRMRMKDEISLFWMFTTNSFIQT